MYSLSDCRMAFWFFVINNLVRELNTGNALLFSLYKISYVYWLYHIHIIIFTVEPDAFFCLVTIAKTIEPTRIFDSCFQRQTEKTTFQFTMNNNTNLFHFCFNLWPVNPLPGNKWGTGADVKIKNSNERQYTLRF